MVTVRAPKDREEALVHFDQPSALIPTIDWANLIGIEPGGAGHAMRDNRSAMAGAMVVARPVPGAAMVDHK